MGKPEPFIKWFQKTANDTDQEAFKTLTYTGAVTITLGNGTPKRFEDILELIDHFEKKYKRKP